ncbi:MAG: hypothetical protein ACHQ1G_06595 [Planctomycetota bacterium]
MSFLERLVGTWRATETLHPSPWTPTGGTAEATLVARQALDGRALVQEYRREDYEALGVMLRDGEQYELFWFDKLEPPGPAKGRGDLGSSDDPRSGGLGDRLVLEREGPLGRARYTYDLLRDGEFAFRIERSRDGKDWRRFLDARYVRVGP